MKRLAIPIGLVLSWPVLAGNVVTDWAQIVQMAIHNAAAPRPPASAEVLHTMTSLAVYDAVVAVRGGYEPYALEMQRSPGADLSAAVATAAYRTAGARVAPSQVGYLDAQYASYIRHTGLIRQKRRHPRGRSRRCQRFLPHEPTTDLKTSPSIVAALRRRHRASLSQTRGAARSPSTLASARSGRSPSGMQAASGRMVRSR